MEPVRGMELLWQPDVVQVYLPLLSDCSNPETLEAAAGGIQNLAACDWQVRGLCVCVCVCVCVVRETVCCRGVVHVSVYDPAACD